MTKEQVLNRLENFYFYEEISLLVKEHAVQCIQVLPLKYIELIDDDYLQVSVNVEWRIDRYVVSIDIGKNYSTFYSLLTEGKVLLGDKVTFNSLDQTLLEALESLYSI